MDKSTRGIKRKWYDGQSQFIYDEDENDMSTQEGEEHLECPNCGVFIGYVGEEEDTAVAAAMLADANRAWMPDEDEEASMECE